jgi:hypothetical protein
MAFGAIVNGVGALAGSSASSGDIAAGTNAVNQAYQQLAAVGLPPNIAQPIIYQQFKQAGTLTPELEQTINQHPSLMAGVQGSAPAQQAQLQALQILQQTGQTGMTPQSQAALNQIRQQVAQDTNSKQQAIQQQFQSQGQGGSGAQLIGELNNAQAGANQENTAGNQVGAMAAQNALQAIGQAGTLGGQIQGQQFGEQAQKAQAQDVINQFNTANQLGVQASNVGAQNQAQAANLGTQQSLQNANTQQANQELLRENQAQNQQYLETLGRASTINQAANGYAGAMNAAGSAAGQAAAAPYQAVGAALNSGQNALMGAFSGGGFGGGSSGYSSYQEPQAMGTSSDSSLGNSAGSSNFGASQMAYDGGIIKKYAFGTPAIPTYAPAKAVMPAMAPAPKMGAPKLPNNKFIKRFNEGGDIDDYQGGKYTDFKSGTGRVPGQASVSGDDPRNDTVKAMLSPGEEVVPRSIAKTTFGKKLAKLLEHHHEVMKHVEGNDPNNE